MMKRLTYTLAGTLLAALALPAQAQTQKQANDTTLTRTVVVEQEYNPDILDANKVNVLPSVEEPAVSKRPVEYDETLLPARQVPATPLEAYTGKETRDKARPGYARLGYGNYGNLDARAAYLFTLSERDRLDIGFRMNGMKGDLECLSLPGGLDWSAFAYHTNANIGYAHTFRRATLDLSGHFDLRNFNFLPGLSFGKQKLTQGGAHLGSASTDTSLPLQYRVETNLNWYERQHDFLGDDTRETQIRTQADVWGAIDETRQVGIAARMDNMIYSGSALHNYTALTLTPYYRFAPGRWDIRLGVNVDLSFGYGKEFQVSPDIQAEYSFSDSHLFYIKATGGKRLNDFQRLGNANPYVLLATPLDATYELVNASIGYKSSPANGLWLNIYAGYQNLQDELFFTGGGSGLPSDMGKYELTPFLQDIQNLNAGLEISYNHRDVFALTASALYRHWFNQYRADVAPDMRPAFVAHVRADIRPLSPLELSVGFRFASEVKDTGMSLKEYTNLYLKGSYEVFRGIAIYVQADNLLNMKNLPYYWGYPVKGANFLGGVSFRF